VLLGGAVAAGRGEAHVDHLVEAGQAAVGLAHEGDVAVQEGLTRGAADVEARQLVAEVVLGPAEAGHRHLRRVHERELLRWHGEGEGSGGGHVGAEAVTHHV
jgi:hypothetical protein